jgi:transcriptional regulator of acetoin/glycerol metabolism
MLPTAYPYDRDALLSAWEQFRVERDCDLELLDPAVLRSWHRCWEAGPDPAAPQVQPVCYDAGALERRLQAHFDLIAIARPFVEDIFQFVGERGVWVFIADRELCILDAVGDLRLQGALHRCGITQGVLLSEDCIGTNAAALALSEGIAVQVVGPEHYCSALQAFTDTAAPIHAPHGEMLAVLGIATLEEDGSPHTLGIVMAAAKAIENQLQADASLAEALQHLAELNVTLESVSKGIVFLDPRGIVTHINARAGEVLGIPTRLAMGRDIRTLLTLPDELETAMERQAPLKEREAIFLRSGRPRSCLVSMNPLWDGSELSGFVLTLEHAAEVRQLVHRMVGARAHYGFDDIIGRDAEMRQLLRYAQSAAQGDANVLLLGESGTGKDMFAQAIHNAGRRSDGPFVSVNCVAVPRELLGMALFGYEGAPYGDGGGDRPGRFELADGGTVFLDNVDGLPLELQGGLVRLIDTKEATRLGSGRVIPVDVRIIAASSKVDLAAEVERGRLRADLFYRLHVLTLKIPPLRKRGNDLLLLIAHLLERFGQRLGKKVTVSPQAMAMLQSYHWPGNVRELENVLGRAMHMLEGNVLTVEQLPAELCMANIGGPGERILTLEEAERQAIIRAGRALRGNVTAMARLLGIGRTTLWRKMRIFNLTADSFKG